jgi:hypothetical protein
MAHKIKAASYHRMRQQGEPRGWTFVVGKVFIKDLKRQAPLTLWALKYRGIYSPCSDLIYQRWKQVAGNNRHLVYQTMVAGCTNGRYRSIGGDIEAAQMRVFREQFLALFIRKCP